MKNVLSSKIKFIEVLVKSCINSKKLKRIPQIVKIAIKKYFELKILEFIIKITPVGQNFTFT